MGINTGNRINILKLVAYLHLLRLKAHLLKAVFFNRAQVRCRGRPDAAVERARHRQAELLDRLVSDRAGEFGDVAKRHRLLGNRVLIVVCFGQIYLVIVDVVGH